jgi:hypothetical protein
MIKAGRTGLAPAEKPDGRISLLKLACHLFCQNPENKTIMLDIGAV